MLRVVKPEFKMAGNDFWRAMEQIKTLLEKVQGYDFCLLQL